MFTFWKFCVVLIIITVLSEESNKRKVLCLNVFVCFLEINLWCSHSALAAASCWSGSGPWPPGEGVRPPCPSTLLLHFFNQREKKAIFWPVCQRRPAATPLQPQPTLSPPRCNRQIKKKKNSPSCKSGGEATIARTYCLTSAALTHLLFFSLSLPIVHFLCCFFPPLVKPVKKPPILINFSLLIFVCISCFVLLDVLIRPIFGPRFCFAKQFPLQEGNELKSRCNISLSCGDSKEVTCRR